MLRKILSTCILISACSGTVSADDSCCENDNSFIPYPFQACVSTLQGEGIGYNQGYSSLKLLYTPAWMCEEDCVYFADIRGHVFNNGKPAANAGLGIRFMDHCSQRVYGANIYYDYRQPHSENLQQIGIGFEVLTSCWDFRINGYIPFGFHNVNFNHRKFLFPGGYIAKCHQRAWVMGGFDAEVGKTVWRKCGCSPCDAMSVYAALGTYYFTPMRTHCGENTWGGKARVAAQFWRYFELEGRTTYDHEFHWRGEGVITFCYPFGGDCCQPICSCDNLRELASQPVRRQEIIVVSEDSCCDWETNFGGFSSSSSSDSGGSTISSHSFSF